MKSYVWYIVLVGLMLVSFFVSGLFFMKSGLVVDGRGIDNEQSIQILRELDNLPFFDIDPDSIVFQRRGVLVEFGEDSFTVFSRYSGENETFVYHCDIDQFDEGTELRVYYNYLPDGSRNVVRIE